MAITNNKNNNWHILIEVNNVHMNNALSVAIITNNNKEKLVLQQLFLVIPY